MVSDPTLPGISVFDLRRNSMNGISIRRYCSCSSHGDSSEARPDLKIVVMSATLDTGLLEEYLAPCRTLTSGGRTFPVSIEHLKREIVDEPPWELAVDALKSS